MTLLETFIELAAEEFARKFDENEDRKLKRDFGGKRPKNIY